MDCCQGVQGASHESITLLTTLIWTIQQGKLPEIISQAYVEKAESKPTSAALWGVTSRERCLNVTGRGAQAGRAPPPYVSTCSQDITSCEHSLNVAGSDAQAERVTPPYVLTRSQGITSCKLSLYVTGGAAQAGCATPPCVLTCLRGARGEHNFVARVDGVPRC